MRRTAADDSNCRRIDENPNSSVSSDAGDEGDQGPRTIRFSKTEVVEAQGPDIDPTDSPPSREGAYFMPSSPTCQTQDSSMNSMG
jgi:hypothetical protein